MPNPVEIFGIVVNALIHIREKENATATAAAVYRRSSFLLSISFPVLSKSSRAEA